MLDAFRIRKTVYFIEIVRGSDGRKEMIRLRRASKNLECEECHGLIKKRENYIRDRFSASSYDCEYGGKVTNDICLKCWKGEVPEVISNNTKRIRCYSCHHLNISFLKRCCRCGNLLRRED